MLAMITIKYDMDTNGNCVTSLSGLWSAVATFAIGIIAFLQARKHQKISNDISDLSLKPEIYLSNSFFDVTGAIKKSIFARVPVKLSGETAYFMADKIIFHIMRPPLIDFSIDEIACNNTIYKCIVTEKNTFGENSTCFEVQLPIPDIAETGTLHCTAVAHYANVYGTTYTKRFSFSISKEQKIPMNITLEPASRDKD